MPEGHEHGRAFIEGLRQAWLDEMRSARNYRALASREKNPERRAIFERRAEAEDRHAERWANRLRALGADPGQYRETLLDRLKRAMLLRSDTATAAGMLEAGEAQADRLYDTLLASAPTAADRADLNAAALEERAHSRALGEFESSAGLVRGKLERMLGRERWHVRGGGWIGQAIYGVNDGLGAAFGVVSGVAGATHANSEFVLLSGLATAIASALSMGSGAYLATKSEREVYEAEIEREGHEIANNPEEEKEELELFYQLKGFSPSESKSMVGRLAEQPGQLLKSLAHEELGLSEQTFPNQWVAASSASISTAVGAAIPVIPFFFASGMTALVISFVVSTLAHFAVGSSKVLVTGRSWLRSGTEMTVIGLGEAAATYLLGMLISPFVG
ncbi:MAG TPA: VIT1/CCC1 transporter family protein [Bacteroidota bacterium]|nr:VIT1/CCC1 transporter family protein [Bacteroidota bacterium]